MPLISGNDSCADKSIAAILSAYQECLVIFKSMTSQVVQRAQPLSGHMTPTWTSKDRLKTPTFHQVTCQVVIERFVFGQFVIEQFNQPITFRLIVQINQPIKFRFVVQINQSKPWGKIVCICPPEHRITAIWNSGSENGRCIAEKILWHCGRIAKKREKTLLHHIILKDILELCYLITAWKDSFTAI